MDIRNVWLATASAVALSIAAGAMAQNAAPSANSEAAPARSTFELQEVMITANKRSESAQSVPISVSAISGDELLGHGVVDTVSLAHAVPGLTMERAPGTTVPFLRGIGANIGQIGSEPSVALYVDDVYIAAGSSFFSNFNSIDRVEVLKGPQGTLFGRNATGGVIQVYTRNPSATPKLDVNVGYANYQTVNGSLYASGGLADGISANISVYGGNQGQGWGKNITTGKDSFQKNWNDGGRIKLLIERDDTTVLLTADHDTTASAQGFYRPAPGTVGYGGIVPGPATAGPTGFYDMTGDIDPYFQNSQSGISAKVTHGMSWANLVSITAYRTSKQYLQENQAGVAFPFIHVKVEDGSNKTLTQELQLLSPNKSRITWVTGLYYMLDKAAYDPLVISGLSAPTGPAEIRSEQRTASYSAFGQAVFPVMVDTGLTLGLRYTADKRKIRASAFVPLAIDGPAPDSPRSDDASKLSWRVAVDHKFTSDVMAYASYNRGFRSGGFNTVVFPGAPIGEAVKPETIDAFAVGEKAEVLDHRLQINTEAFYYKFKNIQLSTVVTGGTVLSNAASAAIKGVDIDVTLIPVRNLTVTAAFEYLHARYDQFPNGVFNTYLPGCTVGAPLSNCSRSADLSGNEIPYAAPISASLVLNYLLPTSIGDLDFNLGYSHGGDFYFEPDNGKGQLDPSLNKQPKIDLVNASARWSSTSKKYDVTLWGKNLTDKKYLSIANEQTLGTGWGPAAPATYGVTFGVHLL